MNPGQEVYKIYNYPPTEYRKCRLLERRFEHLTMWGYPKFRRWEDSQEAYRNVLLFFVAEINYPMPRLGTLNDERYKGLYLRTGVSSPAILLHPKSSIITLIHEYTHHIAWLDRVRVNDEESISHGADFLTLEEMLLTMFSEAVRKGQV